MAKNRQKVEQIPATRSEPDKPTAKCKDRLSKSLLEGKEEGPADRGACEQESTSQGSE